MNVWDSNEYGEMNIWTTCCRSCIVKTSDRPAVKLFWVDLWFHKRHGQGDRTPPGLHCRFSLCSNTRRCGMHVHLYTYRAANSIVQDVLSYITFTSMMWETVGIWVGRAADDYCLVEEHRALMAISGFKLVHVVLSVAPFYEAVEISFSRLVRKRELQAMSLQL